MENKEIKKRLFRLRKAMEENKADYYLITSADCHGSEYVHEHFQARAYFSGFTGSNGDLLVSKEDAALWTDGRYFLQAEEELSGTGISLMRMQEKNIPTIEKYLEERLKPGETLSFDGSCISAALGEKLEKLCEKKGAEISYEKDLADAAWEDRPPLPAMPVWELTEEYAGMSCSDKLREVRVVMEKKGVDYLFLSSLDDIMWLFNLRGSDVACNPVALSYAAVGKSGCTLFLQKKAAGDLSLKHFGAEIKEYNTLYDWIGKTLTGKKILVSKDALSYRLVKALSGKGEPVFDDNPTKLLKAVKNETELFHLRKMYLSDSVAVCRFICRLKKEVGNQELTEISAADRLEKLRREIPGFLDLSFPTICGYRENGAIVHYEATERTNKKIEAEGMLLVDSGGQYMGGTTDITRTIVLGELSAEEKKMFSLVAAGMLRLADAVFPEGTTGRNLDILARQDLWQEGLDYKHGTGHGIGYILNVHEGPQRISWQYNKNAKEYALQAGMIVSDEPGFYKAGEYGIRTENILEVVKEKETEYGSFLGFRHLTYVPIDKEALDINCLSGKDIERINAYHKAVYEKTAPYLKGEELTWLKEACSPIVQKDTDGERP